MHWNDGRPADRMASKSPLQRTPKPIGDYGLIGNMLSAALVGRDGSIDWLCLPRFDSPACFAALLGSSENGRWSLKAVGTKVRSKRRYRPDTAILETQFITPTGAVTVIDFMPPAEDDTKLDVVRIVRGDRGTVDMEMELVLRFGYGAALPWVQKRDYGLSAIAGPDAVELHTPVKLTGRDMRTFARFKVGRGEEIPFTLSYHPAHKSPNFVRDSRQSLQLCEAFWRDWIQPCAFPVKAARWSDAVKRSLITLKLLTYQPSGAIVAAPTTSLPEDVGGERNWDYRLCWLRDSALTLYALLNSGFRDEAARWREWLLRAIAGHPEQLQIVYGVAGERWLQEAVVPWLSGYAQSRPVRVGNDAFEQRQLDIYGELMDTLHVAREAELPPAIDAWELQCVMLEHLAKHWHEPDRGMWEVRGPARSFTHSRVMCWVAFDRAISSATRFRLPGPLKKWRALRREIHADVCRHGVDKHGRFVQYYGGEALDASSLLMAQVGFLPAGDKRFRATVAAIERELLTDGFVRRYSPSKTDDGLAGSEGAFLPCSFWLADAYVLLGRRKKAEALFERLLGLTNDLGLLSEEYDTASRRLVGNFPQAFTHVGLINTAFNLIHLRGPAHQRAKRTAPDAKQRTRRK